ncbi:hypothetical protein THAR02_03824 [Trichoderma harzianum]|uniref:Uncharacterized protein n=1 Tax=Trichoderma harzianum TaxID=5544 RepID=A0A0F9XVH1_TRIHA|nr:hypothetical protein THAR02_03824 [Trichoderma harzianum]
MARQAHFDSRIMRKLLGKAAPDASSGDLTNSQGNIPTVFRPSKSQNAVHPVGSPIACLDITPDHRAVVLGGPHVLKTIVADSSVDSSFSFKFTDGVDVRAAITAQKPSGSGGSLVADQLNIRDVKWQGASTVFTACAAGRIFAYDVARLGSGGASDPLDYIQIQEDSRQVNSLDVNPHLKSWVLSGSQDGVVRVFDVSAPLQTRAGFLTFRQRYSQLKTNDSVRQVKWSPKVGHEMACCTDSGVIMKWDVRQAARPLLRINAHEKSCSAIAWHSDGIHLISAGWDAKLHVWDFGASADKRQKPKWSITTPAPVTTVAWRPGLWSATAQTRRLAQVAVTYDETSNRRYGTSVVHIWDLARPAMPYKEIERFDSSPSALSWLDQDMLWTVGRDGMFNQCDVAYAPKVIDRMSTSAMAFSSRGDVVMFLDERPQPPRPHPSVGHDSEVVPRTPFSTSPNTPMLSVSRSDSEEDVLGSFLGPRRRTIRKRRFSTRSGLPMSTTPPSLPSLSDDGKQVLGLEQSINVTGMFKTQQGMASGHVPSAKSVGVYQYLSSIYLETLQRELPLDKGDKSLIERVAGIMEEYAVAAENVRLYRLSQTWRILAYAMSLLMEKRADFHLRLRTARFRKRSLDEGKGSLKKTPSHIHVSRLAKVEDPPRRPSGQAGSVDGRLSMARSLLSEEIESTSNVPTPLARPVGEGDTVEWDERHYLHGKKLTPIIEPESLNLGPSAHGSYRPSPRQRHDSAPISEMSHDSEASKISITEGYDFYDMEALARAIDVPMTKKPHDDAEKLQRLKAIRHDSTDSFAQVFSASDSSDPTSPRRDSSNPPSSLKPESLKISAIGNKIGAEFASLAHDDGEQHSPKQTKGPSNGTATHPRADSPEEVFMISQTTAATDETFPSQISFASQTDSEVHQGFAGHHPTPSKDIQMAKPASPAPVVTAPEYDPSPNVVVTDYFPWPGDGPYPFPTDTLESKTFAPRSMLACPLDPYSLITRALEFESRTSALNASAIVLLLKPLVPESIIDTFQATAVLRQHHSRLMGMSLFVEAALLRNLAIKGWPAGLPYWGENYTSLFTPAQQGVKAGFMCSNCRKPREIDRSNGDSAFWTCEKCRQTVTPCAVCGHRDAEIASSMPTEVVDIPSIDSWMTEWWYCPSCCHGGHASCMQTWHAALRPSEATSSSTVYSDGCCPVDGCGHACLPGKYRGETATARANELSHAVVDGSRMRDGIAGVSTSRRSSPGRTGPSSMGVDRSIRSDANDVLQSKAVGMAREALNKSSGGGILSSSPGRTMTGERERRKSVKFARTER